jgi:hypothetical protein
LNKKKVSEPEEEEYHNDKEKANKELNDILF